MITIQQVYVNSIKQPSIQRFQRFKDEQKVILNEL